MAGPRTIQCPRCGLEQPPAVDCARCGVVFAKLERPKPAPAPRPARPPRRPASNRRPQRRPLLGPRLSLQDHALLYDQLARLLHAGVPLADGLDTIAESAGRGALAVLCRDLAAPLRRGTSIAKVFAERPEIPPAEASLIAAAERVGALPATLQGLAARRQRLVTLRGRLVTTLAYPLLMAAVSVVILAIPTWLFGGRGAFAREVTIGLATLTLAVLAAAYGVPRLLGLPAVQGAMRRALWHLPVVGRVYRLSVWTTWAEHLRATLDAGLIASMALRDAGLATGDPRAEVAMERAATAVEKGGTLAEALRDQRLLPQADIVVLTGAERVGTLAESLGELAASHARALENGLEASSRIVGALLVLLLMSWVASNIVETFTRSLGGGMDQAMEQIQREVGGPGGAIDTMRKQLEDSTAPIEREMPYQRPP